MKKLLTEREVLNAWQKRRREIFISSETILTPAAADAAKVRGIEIVVQQKPTPPASKPQMLKIASAGKVVIGSDHGGFELKEILKTYLKETGIEVEDVGTHSSEPADYPDFAEAVAQKVAGSGELRGVIIDGAGAGSAITANKLPGIRAAACYDVYTARNSRLHNNANILTLGSRVTGMDTAKEILKTWLQTEFEGGRHEKRVDKITAIEKKYLK
jgi:ribose 5-phosphate isomerase B